MATGTAQMKVLDPVGVTRAEMEKRTVTRRLDDLRGKTIGFIDDGFSGADYFMKGVKSLIEQRFPGVKTQYWTKPLMSRPAPPKLIEEAAAACDAVVVGICA